MKWVSPVRDKALSTQTEITDSTDGNHFVRGSRNESELEFTRLWEDFRASSSETERDKALVMAIDIFCKLARQMENSTHLVNKLVDGRVFSFVIAKALVTEIEKLKKLRSTGCQDVEKILQLFMETSKDERSIGANMLYALDYLVSSTLSVQPLLDAGLLPYLVWVLHTILQKLVEGKDGKLFLDPFLQHTYKFMVEGCMIHIIKALAQHPGAAECLTEDDSLHQLFDVVVKFNILPTENVNSTKSSFPYVTLHRQALQILGLLLHNDTGISAEYIHRNQLVQVLVKHIKEFDNRVQDIENAVAIVDVLRKCIQLSYRPQSSVSLRDDLYEAQGYHYLRQFTLKIAETCAIPEDRSQKDAGNLAYTLVDSSKNISTEAKSNTLNGNLPPVFTWLLDILVELSQIGISKNSITMGGRRMASELFVIGTHTSDGKKTAGDGDSNMDGKVQDIEAVQVLQDIFLKAKNVQLQSEVLDRLLHIFSSNVENYGLCQRLRTLPLLIQNMPAFPQTLQERLLKILECAVIVVNHVPEQELLSLCCLFQQHLPVSLCKSILLFFTKVLSFDKEYKKILREAGALEALIDDLKKLDTSSMLNFQKNLKSRAKMSINKDLARERCLRSSSFPSSADISSYKAQLFGEESTVSIAWDCLITMLKGAEGNQMAFRRENGVALVLPLLSQSCHRGSVLRLLTCLICEDINQSHSEEFSALIEIAKNGAPNMIGQEIKVDMETKRDVLWAICRILSVNNACNDVFGATAGFDLLFTVLYSFQDIHDSSQTLIRKNKTFHIDVFEALINVIKAAVSGNPVNRGRLHKVLSSQPFKETLCDKDLLSLEHEELVADLLLSLVLEKKGPPGEILILCHKNSWAHPESDSTPKYEDTTPNSKNRLDTKQMLGDGPHLVLNPGAILVVLSCLKCFSSQLQIKVLGVIKILADVSTENQECITAAGCVSLLLEIADTVDGDIALVEHVLNIVEVLGSYRLSATELKTLVRWVWLARDASKKEFGLRALHSVKRLIQRQSRGSENTSLIPFMEMSMARNGYACLAIPLGERAWPPSAGYSFSCWIQFKGLSKKKQNLSEVVSSSRKLHSKNRAGTSERDAKIRIFSVGSAEEKTQVYAELYLDDCGVLVLATGNSSTLAFNSIYLEEGLWYHIVVVHNKPSALTGLFQSSSACLFVNGQQQQAGKLAYSASPVRKTLQATIGTPPTALEVLPVHWNLGSCYLFEEVLSAPSVFLMYALGRGYSGLFQDMDLLRFLPHEACGGGNLATFEALEVELALGASNQKVESNLKRNPSRTEGSGVFWDLDRLAIFAAQLASKKLVFCFDGTCVDAIASGSQVVVNLADPLSAAASPLGGIPRIARFYGDVTIFRPCSLSENMRKIGGVAVILALIEAATSKEMLHVAISLLINAVSCSPHNVRDMSVSKGYHLLALFLRHHVCFFDMQDLDMLIRIAACEAATISGSNVLVSDSSNNHMPLGAPTPSDNLENPILSNVNGETVSPIGSQIDPTDYFQQEIMSHVSDIDAIDVPTEISNSLVLFNLEMMEYVLLDWTLWVAAPLAVQVALLSFIESLVSMHRYRNHNLTMLRRVNIIHHLLVILQRGDVEIPILEKLVVLLGILLEDGFIASELKSVVDFVVMTFEPPEMQQRSAIPREPMRMQVIVRNMLLEMLIELQVTISSEEILERWHKIVSSKIITFLLDEAVHPTSMRWVMTLLGICLSSSTTFASKFSSSGGFEGLLQVLPVFFDCPELYYILFCLIFGKPVYPRNPEVRMLDFLEFMPDDGSVQALKFTEFLGAIIAMSKAAFDRVTLRLQLADEVGDQMQINFSIDENFRDIMGNTEVQGEALLHKTSAARLLNGEAAAPEVVTSILRYMVDHAKMCRRFSSALWRQEILDSCVDLYFSAVRSAYAIQCSKHEEVKELSNCMKIDDGMSSNMISSDFTSEQPVSNLAPQVEEVRNLTIKDTVLSITRSVSGPYKSTNVPDKEDDVIHSEDVVCDMNLFALDSLDHLVVLAAVSRPAEMENHIERNITSPANGSHFTLSPIETSPIPTTSKHADSISVSPFDRSLSWIRRSTCSETNVGTASLASLTTHSTCTTSFHSDIYYRISAMDSASASEGEIPDIAILEVKPEFLLKLDSLGSAAGPCSAAAAAVLDLIAEVLAYGLCEQVKSVPLVEAVLEAAPLFIMADSVLCFQGLCLSRLVGFFERRLLRDEEEITKRLEKAKWSANLEAIGVLLVDRVYMGAFPEPGSVLKILEFLLSMLQLANKDRKLESAVNGKGFLSRSKGGARQVDSYLLGLFKSMNRMIMYCFTPSFLSAIGEYDFIASCLPGTEISADDGGGLFLSSTVDICTVLQLIIANKALIFCAVNVDTDLICCLCVNGITMLWDTRPSVRTHAVDIMRILIAFRKPVLEELLIVRPSQGEPLDILHGGLDRLVSSDLAQFYVWFRNSRELISKVLEQCTSIMWMKYVASSAKLPGVWMKFGESRRKREMSRRLRQISKIEDHHWDQMNERRYALDVVRDAMATELRVLRQDKYGWVLHAESEWEVHLQHLAHEYGALPMLTVTSKEEPVWELSTTEGPYRMRKKLVRRKVKINTLFNNKSQSLLESTQDDKLDIIADEVKWDVMDPDYDSFFHLFSVGNTNQNMPSYSNKDLLESVEEEEEDTKGREDCSSSSSMKTGVAPSQRFDRCNSAFSAQTSTIGDFSASCQGSPGPEYLDKDVPDDGEYLIRPFLEPGEKVRYRYNCERVVGLEKKDGLFLIGEMGLYIIENFYIDDTGHICEKVKEDEMSVIDQALGVKYKPSAASFKELKPNNSWKETSSEWLGARAWAYSGGAWGREEVQSGCHMVHPWHMWKLDCIHEILKRRYQLRPVAIELFSIDGCNDLLVFHKHERDEVFRNLLSMNLPRNFMLDTTISVSAKQENGEGRLFKMMAKSFSKRWQNGEISNFQYLMHLNTLAGRGYNDLTQYPVFPWVLADYDSEHLNLDDPKTFRRLDKPMGALTPEREEDFRRRYDTWDDPEIPSFHYGSHYSSAGIVLFYLIRVPPFTMESKKLQGGQFDHADRLFSSIKDTWLSASQTNTADVKELIPEFYYLPEMLENRFDFDFGHKQSGDKVSEVILPPWAKGSAREFICKHREALESQYVSENLHHWIDLIFGFRQQGQAAVDATNVFFYLTYEGAVDIDSISDPAMKASILAQINNFGQTPRQLFPKPHPQRRLRQKPPPMHVLRQHNLLFPEEIRTLTFPISQIAVVHDKILAIEANRILKPPSFTKYISWGFPDRSLRIFSYDQDRLISTHESLHGRGQIQCVDVSKDGRILVTGGEDGIVAVWRVRTHGARKQQDIQLERSLCAHTDKITCLAVCQPYSLIVSGSEDGRVILWELSSLEYVRQLPLLPAAASAVHANEMTGNLVTASGTNLSVWSINGDLLATVHTSQVPSDVITSITSSCFSDWMETNWFLTGHRGGSVKLWHMDHNSVKDRHGQHNNRNQSYLDGSDYCILDEETHERRENGEQERGKGVSGKPEYQLILVKELKWHKQSVSCVHLTNDLKQLFSGDSGGHLISWILPEELVKIASLQEKDGKL